MSRFICILNYSVTCDIFAKAEIVPIVDSSKLICMPYRFFFFAIPATQYSWLRFKVGCE